MGLERPDRGRHAEVLLGMLADTPIGRGGQSTRILLVHPDPVTASEIHARLSRPAWDIHLASSEAAMRRALAEGGVALIICDPALPDVDDSRALLGRLLQYAIHSHLPVVVLAGARPTLDPAECYALGADAFLPYPTDLESLVALVSSRLARVEMLRRSMLQDSVTGLPNLVAFRGIFERASVLSARECEPLSLSVLEFVGLAEVGEVDGPLAASELLGRAAEVIAGAFRKSDTLARRDATSLVVLFPNTDRDGALRALEKAYHRFGRAAFPGLDPAQVRLRSAVVEVNPAASLEATIAAARDCLTEEAPSPRRRLFRRSGYPGGDLPALVADIDPTARRPPRHRILLAEDDRLTASIVRHRLERAGYEVHHFADGEEALAAAPGLLPSLLLLDIKMPRMDGLEVLQRVRSIRPLRGVRVILLTSMGAEPEVARGFELGADDYMLKPFSPIELLARIERQLRDVPPPRAPLGPPLAGAEG